jgi:hypothetical protein
MAPVNFQVRINYRRKAMLTPNPYQSPCDCGEGIYDHRLLWRIVKASAVIFLGLMILNSICLAKELISPTVDDPVATIRSLIHDKWVDDFQD